MIRSTRTFRSYVDRRLDLGEPGWNRASQDTPASASSASWSGSAGFTARAVTNAASASANAASVASHRASNVRATKRFSGSTWTNARSARRRRDTLSAWEISPDQWRKLIEGLPEQPVMGRYKPRTHWGDGKCRLASTWAWTQLTHGDHIYAPAVRPDPQARRPG